jgi:hypothetical protein
VGQGTNTIAYSTDGLTWTGIGTTIFDIAGYGIAWNGYTWIAVGEGSTYTIATSLDGVTWTGLNKSIFTTKGEGIAWNGSRTVAVGAGGNTIAYTDASNALTWKPLGGIIFSTQGTGVAWNGRYFLATGQGTNTLAYSPDGSNNWTGMGSSVFPTACYGVAGNPEVGPVLIDSQIVLDNNGPTGSQKLVVSCDASNTVNALHLRIKSTIKK